MKRSTIVGITNDAFVHPQELTVQLQNLKAEAEERVASSLNNIEATRNCPACNSHRHEPAFLKKAFSYNLCLDCNSLFIDKKISNEQLNTYYCKSSYAAFLSSDEYTDGTADFRNNQIQRRADQILINRQKVNDGKGNILIYAPKTTALASEFADRNISNVSFTSSPWENDEGDGADKKYDVITAFDIIERLTNPLEELKKLSALLNDGGRLLTSTRSGSGFDLLTLWHHLELSPVEHMNLITVEGIQSLMNSAGLNPVEVSTPGHLDVQFVKSAKKDKNIRTNRFVDYLLDERDDFTHEALQQFLQKGLLSSHLFMIAEKK